MILLCSAPEKYPFGALCPVFGSPSTSKVLTKPLQVQQRVTRKVKGMKYMLYEEQKTELALLSLNK